MVTDTAHILHQLSNPIKCTMTIGFPQCNYINWSTQVSDLDQMIDIQSVASDDANKTWLQTSSNNTIPFVARGDSLTQISYLSSSRRIWIQLIVLSWSLDRLLEKRSIWTSQCVSLLFFSSNAGDFGFEVFFQKEKQTPTLKCTKKSCGSNVFSNQFKDVTSIFPVMHRIKFTWRAHHSLKLKSKCSLMLRSQTLSAWLVSYCLASNGIHCFSLIIKFN